MTAAPVPESVDAQVIEARFDSWRDVPVTEDHAAFLAKQAITPAAALSAGIRSVTDVRDLPEEFTYYGQKAAPALLFPWTTVDGEQILQLRPDEPIVLDSDGPADRPRKYVFPKGQHCAFGVINDVPGDAVIIVEGTKQSLVAGEYLEDYPVYAIPGCRGWWIDGAPSPDLWVVAGKDVVVIFDGDLTSNPDVYAAGEAFTEELKNNGASSVKFARVAVSAAAGKRNAIDDILAKRPEHTRTPYLEGLLENAKRLGGNGGIPRPKAKAGAEGGQPPAPPTGTPDRPTIVVNDDRFKVMRHITATLVDRWNRDRIFNYGKVISLRTGTEMKALSKDAFAALIAEAALTGTLNDKTGFQPAWPDGQTMGACLTMTEAYAELDKISRVPFVRQDGSICQTPGYDEASRTFLVLDEGMEALNVPEDPTPAQVAKALRFLVETWLVDFWPSFPEAADKANLLGLVLTPFIRGLVPLVPMAIINGREAGVGKNLLLDTFLIATTGSTAEPLPWNREDDEIRKVVTGAFGSAADVFAFDEAHHIESATMARAITSITYTDRILGGNTIADYPNRVTWVALGNGVAVVGDMSRRVYQIRFAPQAANPMDRSASEFVHDDPRGWTLEHRPQILEACLTLIRAWFAAGKPAAPEVNFGSFEAWSKTIGGILHHAGLEGFLHNLKEFRSDTDHQRKYWSMHLAWLQEEFGTTPFTAAEVTRALKGGEDGHVEPPPSLLDPTAKGYSRDLGQAYHRYHGRDFGGLWLTKAGVSREKKALWTVLPTGRHFGDDDPRSTGVAPNPAPVAPETGPRFEGDAGTAGTALTPLCERDIYISAVHTLDSPRVQSVGQPGDTYICAPSATATETPAVPAPPAETEGGFTVTAPTRWVANDDPVVSPSSHLAPHAYVPTERDTRCPRCKGQKELVPPARLWLACPTCHPSTFTRS